MIVGSRSDIRESDSKPPAGHDAGQILDVRDVVDESLFSALIATEPLNDDAASASNAGPDKLVPARLTRSGAPLRRSESNPAHSTGATRAEDVRV